MGLATFAQLTTESLYTLHWLPLSPLIIAHSHGGSGPHLVRDSLGPPKLTSHTLSRSV